MKIAVVSEIHVVVVVKVIVGVVETSHQIVGDPVVEADCDGVDSAACHALVAHLI